MKTQHDLQMNRRHWLRLTTGTLLALGLWPGRLRSADNGVGGAFRFAVLNDTHFQSAKCPAWFERVRASLLAQQPKPEFCLVVGDLSEHGTATELGPMRDVLRGFGLEWHAVMGNHDHVSDTDRSPWDKLFPDSLNYHFEHRGWQFIGLDSTQGVKYKDSTIQPTTLRWVDAQLPKLNPAAPTVLFTHFPLGASVTYRPLNADELLARLKEFNLAAVYDGHFHGFTERKLGRTVLTTNRCCAISRTNHDGTLEKGYFICTVENGQIRREFVEVKPA